MAKLLATDLDGTLFYPGQIKTCIPKKNIKFLQRWIDSGNRLIVVTSRSHEFVDKLKDEIKRPFDVVACSSAEIYADGNLLRDVAIPNKTLAEILTIINDDLKPLSYMMTTKGYPCIINANREVGNFFLFFYRIWKFFQFKREEPFIVSNEKFLEQLNNGRVYKIMIFFGLGHSKKKFTKELNKQFRSKYSMLEFSWTTKVIEITPYGCNKGMGLKYYTEAMGFKKEDVYVVGDSGNDISMFTEFYENSYCMRHAYTSVRKYAKHTVSRVYKLEKMLLKGDNNNEQN
jgi:Cof subfamily protein (haloacid dehalogenase superfamily)